MRRRIPNEKCGGHWCAIKEKLDRLWNRTIGSITKINNVTPDGDGKFSIEAGDNITIDETGTGNGIRINATGGGGGGSDYEAVPNSGIVIDNQAHTIGTEDIIRGTGDIGSYTTPIRIVNGRAEAIGYEVAKQSDLQTVFGQVMLILDGTTKVPNAQQADLAANANHAYNADNATNATYLGNVNSSIGSDSRPVRISHGQAVAVSESLATDSRVDIIESDVLKIIDGSIIVGQASTAGTAVNATNATNATNAQYLGSNTSNVGSDTQPVKIVNGQAVAVPYELTPLDTLTTFVADFTSGAREVGKAKTAAALDSSNITIETLNIDVPGGTTISTLASRNVGAGTYLVTANLMNTVSLPASVYLMGIATNSSSGWGQLVERTTADYLRMSMTRLIKLDAAGTIFVNFFNGSQMAFTTNNALEVSIVKLA